MTLNLHRCRRLAEEAIDRFSLDLRGLVILTEAATNYFSLTPMVAAMAGADRVIATGRDSRYGTLATVRAGLTQIAEAWGIADRLIITGNRNSPVLAESDVVTNLGFVRPIDEAFLRRLKQTASISLMWETWEFRDQDLDIDACRKLGIPVLGTNEEHSDLKIFTYLGHVAIKLLFELDIEIFRSRIAVIGSGKFADSICQVLRNSGVEVVTAVVPDASMARHSCFSTVDAILVVEHRVPDMLLGPGGWLDPEWLAHINPSVGIAHICGKVSQKSLQHAGLRFTPSSIADPGYMSVTTDYVGPRPLIDLHTAGLKIGAMLARSRLRGLSALDAELEVLKNNPIAQGFKGIHPAIEVQ